MNRFACASPACAHEFSEASREDQTLCPVCYGEAYRTTITDKVVNQRLAALIRRLEAEDGPLVEVR